MKVLFKLNIAILCIITFSCSLCGCGLAPKTAEDFVIDGFYFHSPVHIEVYDKPIENSTRNSVKDVLSQLEKEFSLSENDSFTSRFNSLRVNESLNYSTHAKEVLDVCSKAYRLSNGKFDISIFPLSKLWKFYPNFPDVNFVPPTRDETDGIVKSGIINYCNLQLDENGVTKLLDGVEIDFGGTLKGYASDKVYEILTANGHTSGYINIGGSSLNVLAVDNFSISHPRKDGNIVELSLKGKKDVTVSTSGDYERTYTYGNQKYCHIIDAHTGSPTTTNVASVTIITEKNATASDGTKVKISGGLTDGLTTYLCLLNHSLEDKNGELVTGIKNILSLREFSNAYIFAVYDDGVNKQIITNKLLNADFTLLDGEYSVCSL